MANRVAKQNFKSITEFYNYITTQPKNEVFASSGKGSSETGRYSFTGTNSFSEASNLLLNGWDSMAKELETKLKAATKTVVNKQTRRSAYDVVGGNCSVPRYLQGVPTNMINQKVTTRKQKVVTLNKSICYAAFVSREEIIEESIKALKIVREIEAAGTRVNLNLVWSTSSGNEVTQMTLRLKSADERLNISKLAFPLVHPSMLRRICFKWLEVNEVITDTGYPWGYGRPTTDTEFKEMLDKNEIFLPAFIKDPAELVKNI